MTIRAVALDAVGTILHPQPPALDVYAHVGRSYGSQLSSDHLKQRFRNAFQQEDQLDRQANWRTSELRERERWQRIVAATLNDANDGGACFRALWEHFARPQAWCLDPQMAIFLRRLHEAGYPLFLASNFDQRLHSVCAGFAELACIQQVIISAEVGWRKPARPFFEAVCQAIDLPADQILFVGDDAENDLRGPESAGLKAVLVGNEPAARPVDDILVAILSGQGHI